jgi:hypothetical protein
MSREILVDGEALAYCASSLSSLSSSLEDLAATLGDISAQSSKIEYHVKSAAPSLSGLSGASPHHGDVQGAIGSYAGAVRAIAQYSGNLSGGVRKGAQVFEECERSLSVNFLSQDSVQAALSSGGVGGSFGGGSWASGSDFLSGLAEFLGDNPVAGLVSLLSGQTVAQGVQNATTLSGSYAAGGEWFGYHSDTADVSVGYANFSANGSTGLYQRDADGNLVFSPYATGGVMLSAGLLTANWSDSIGDDMLGAHASANAEVLTANAGATGTINLLDEHGRINPSASVNASAELTAASVSAETGITVAGVDVTASAEASVGLGAHMNVGYQEGVVSLDVGAAVGIGGSVALEVDVGGAVNAVMDAAESVLGNLFG